MGAGDNGGLSWGWLLLLWRGKRLRLLLGADNCTERIGWSVASREGGQRLERSGRGEAWMYVEIRSIILQKKI